MSYRLMPELLLDDEVARGSPEAAGRSQLRGEQRLHDHLHGRLVSHGAGEMALAAARVGARALVLAEREVAGPHLDALPVHGLDEPATAERNDPLRLRVFMPGADPADGQDRH